VEIFGLSPIELVVIMVVAILVFGQRLPQVAGEAAATLQKVKRSLSDLRRETGIDQEIYRAKREFEDAARQAREANVAGAVRHELDSAKRELRSAFEPPPSVPAAPPPAPDAPTPPRSPDPAGPGPG
jgi:Sec-independent protein translocase protein TatA